MQGFKVTSTQDLTDWNALIREITSRAQDNARRTDPVYLRWLPPILWIGLVAIFVWVAETWHGLLNVWSMLIALGLFIAFAFLFGWRQRRGLRPAKDGAFMGDTEFDFEPDGFEVTRAHSRSRIEWALLCDVTQTATHIYLWIDQSSAYSIRIANLPAPMTGNDAVARLREFMAGTRAKPRGADPAPIAATSDPAPVTAPPVTAQAIPTVMQEFQALLRLEFHRPVDGTHLHGREATIFLLALCALGVWIGLDRLNYPADAEFMWFALPSMSAVALATLLIAWTMARLSSPRIPMRRTLLLVLGGAPVVIAGLHFAPQIGKLGCLAIAMLVGGWAGMLVETGLRAISGLRQLRAFLGTCVLTILLISGSDFLFMSPGLWYAPNPEFDPSSEASAAREQLLFDQGSRIDADVANMAPSTPQKASAYFVGFAGYGEQRVFAEEIATAANVFAVKFSTGKRQLLLVNDQRDEERHPLASVSALRHALLGIGNRMDKEHDVLFLALSSHGSADATISVSNMEMMYWRDLSATDLRAMLDEAGIRWRVIVISACHSGSFIESLANEQTIVLTAAAKENSSFGCSDDRDLTYFGEAFYRDALPGAADLRSAFAAARLAIEKRENKEGRKPSDPQAHFGPLMEARLAELKRAAP